MDHGRSDVCRSLYGLDSCSAVICCLFKIARSSFLSNGEAPSVATRHLANNAIGIFGIIAVVLAGWTSANPTIYRAGLAFLAIIPKTSPFWVTIIAVTVATIAGLIPAFAMKLLGFVALYGFIFAPFGAIKVFEHFFAKNVGVTENYAEVAGITFNKSVFYAWLISFGLFYFISIQFEVFLSFVTLPACLLCRILFLLFSKYTQKKNY